ncbi:MAG: ABC exporter membrane fusion protein [Cyanobacteria bacterium SID2]|nr:ABC exporter membrane fusion protein [Cyanobacteria bacterium SID2]MBP0004980.1 ABC exporter membrane fusion protein [Cyanobacteria bacterium SBC]
MTARFIPQIPLQRTAILGVSIAIGVGFIAGQFVSLQQNRPDVATSSEIDRSPPPVSALGRLVPNGDVVRLSAPISVEGIRIDRLNVEEGDLVDEGQVIAVLDSVDRRTADLERARSRVDNARSRLAQVEAGAKTGEIDAQAARFQGVRAELEGQIASQQANLANLEASLRGEIAEQQATIERLKAELQHARTECQRYNVLYTDGAISASGRDSVCLSATTSTERLVEAQATLNRIVTSGREGIQQARAELDRTTTTLQRQIEENRATLDAIAEVRPVDVRTAQTEVALAAAEVHRAEADLEQSFVRSPITGQVLKIHARPGEVVESEGIIEIGRTQTMEAIAEVYQTDIGRIQLGQTATLTSPVFEGELKGEAIRLGTQVSRQDIFSQQPGSDVDRRVVEVRIRLTPESSERVQNLTNLQVQVTFEP